MKRALVLVLAVTFLVACGGSGSSSTAGSQLPKQLQHITAVFPNATDIVKIGDNVWYSAKAGVTFGPNSNCAAVKAAAHGTYDCWDD